MVLLSVGGLDLSPAQKVFFEEFRARALDHAWFTEAVAQKAMYNSAHVSMDRLLAGGLDPTTCYAVYIARKAAEGMTCVAIGRVTQDHQTGPDTPSTAEASLLRQFGFQHGTLGSEIAVEDLELRGASLCDKSAAAAEHPIKAVFRDRESKVMATAINWDRITRLLGTLMDLRVDVLNNGGELFVFY